MSKKRFKGTVVSDKMQKTVIVAVELPKKHPLYNKEIKNTKRFKVRNEVDARLHDTVVIEECRPYSKEVTWKVVEVIPSK